MPWRPRKGVEVYLYSFFSLNARWDGWSTPRPGLFTRYPLHRSFNGPQGRSGRVLKISPQSGSIPGHFPSSTDNKTDLRKRWIFSTKLADNRRRNTDVQWKWVNAVAVASWVKCCWPVVGCVQAVRRGGTVLWSAGGWGRCGAERTEVMCLIAGWLFGQMYKCHCWYSVRTLNNGN